jgi:hypothetical protein
MADLPIKFTRKGSSFKQLRRSKKYAFYERTESSGTPTQYEVIVILWRKKHTWPNGNTTEAGEHYPGSEMWGTYGWSFSRASHSDPHLSAWKCYLNLCRNGRP